MVGAHKPMNKAWISSPVKNRYSATAMITAQSSKINRLARPIFLKKFILISYSNYPQVNKTLRTN